MTAKTAIMTARNTLPPRIIGELEHVSYSPGTSPKPPPPSAAISVPGIFRNLRSDPPPPDLLITVAALLDLLASFTRKLLNSWTSPFDNRSVASTWIPILCKNSATKTVCCTRYVSLYANSSITKKNWLPVRFYVLLRSKKQQYESILLACMYYYAKKVTHENR